MKRSEINAVIREMADLVKANGFQLPPFTGWTPGEWADKGHEYDEIRDNGLGWDITDYGLGDFGSVGLALITIRNGSQHDKRYDKPYAEKLLALRERQLSPMHFHWYKMEDIINRGGGHLMLQLYNAAPDGSFADTGVVVHSDGRTYTVPAGTAVRLMPGESITLRPGTYHNIFVEDGFGPVLIGEVSQCNDDATDNRFYEPVGRFPENRGRRDPGTTALHRVPARAITSRTETAPGKSGTHHVNPFTNTAWPAGPVPASSL